MGGDSSTGDVSLVWVLGLITVGQLEGNAAVLAEVTTRKSSVALQALMYVCCSGCCRATPHGGSKRSLTCPPLCLVNLQSTD